MDREIEKLLKSKLPAIEEGLLPSSELTEIKESVEQFLNQHLNNNSLLSLRYKKFKLSSKGRILYSDEKGYPISGKFWLSPYISFYEQYIGEKKIITRLENEKLWVERREDSNEQHLFVGDKQRNGEKVHLIIGETGEIRIDKKDRSPGEILQKVESILTRPDGSVVKTTLEFLRQEGNK
jgi:hypothetical protein